MRMLSDSESTPREQLIALLRHMPTLRFTAYAVRWDCAAQGCRPAHAEDGQIAGWGIGTRKDSYRPVPEGVLDGKYHAFKRIKRTVSISAWKDDDG